MGDDGMKQDLRIHKTQKTLFQALLQLLQTNNFSDITVTKLCVRAEVNRSTFYAHYTNIDDLFETHMIGIMKELTTEYEKAHKQITVGEKTGLTNVFQHILNNRVFYNVLFSEKLPTKYLSLFSQYYMQVPKEIISKSGQSEMDEELYYTFCISATIGVINHWCKSNYQKSPLEMSMQTVLFFSKSF